MIKALVVDDEKDIGLMVSTFLKKTGLDADYASRVFLARQLMMKNSYQFFFLDLSLPDGTGFDLIPLIKEKSKDSIIVIVSAYDSKEEIQKAMDLGAVRFIKKPFTRSEIIDVINTFHKDKL